MMTPQAFAADFIRTWEDGGSTDPVKTHSLLREDNGNWTGGKVGSGALVGSQHGVTPAALAAHRGVTVQKITLDVMRALTLDEAGQIALGPYYRTPRLDRLGWNQVTASLFDMAWGAGPVQAVRLFQRMIEVADDGKIGPATVGAYQAYLAARGLDAVAWEWSFVRARFYAEITKKKPTNLAFILGWLNRTAHFTPDSAWWGRFAA
ncbi:putative peptidoglycan-binding domain-containing protein [uncultured Sphingomonas sp.]|uniref:putative peptidoglycan-binding domain-containing protein n=1 Tax=uncultured Sphingomonas sp. TaxID=158754 RepID=UPI0025FE3359|nr:putative peptidoglycan-binding domain-containing protein [uncultured Sphingomonas sp.]